MKKIAIITLSIFFFLALLDGIIHTPWVKEKTLSYLKKNIQESGWDIQVDEIQSTFPSLHLKGVKIIAPEFILTFGKLDSDLSFIRLWKKELVFTNLKGDDVNWEMKQSSAPKSDANQKPSSFLLSVPSFSLTNASILDHLAARVTGSFSLYKSKKGTIVIDASGIAHPKSDLKILDLDWNFSGKVIRNLDASWSFDGLKASSDYARVKGFATLAPSGRLTKGSFQIRSDHFGFEDVVQIKGQIIANVDITEEANDFAILTNFRMPNLEIDEMNIKNVQGQVNCLYTSGLIDGSSSLSAHFLNHNWQATIPFKWNKGIGLTFSNGEIHSPVCTLNGEMSIDPDLIITGDASFVAEQLHDLFPAIYGQAIGKISGEYIEKTPTFRFDATISDAHFEDFSAQKVIIHSDLITPMSNLKGMVICDIENGHWKNLVIDSAFIETSKEKENWPFQIILNGKWEHPLEVDLNGFWSFNQKTMIVSLQSMTGSFFNHPLLLPSPANFLMSKDVLRLSDFSLQVADANIKAVINRKENFSEVLLNIKNLPIDFLSLNPLDVAVVGAFNLDLAMQEKDKKLQGDLSANLENLEMRLLGQENPLTAAGVIEGHFNQDLLEINGSLSVRDAPLVSLNLSLPIHFGIWPFTAELLYSKEVKGHFYLDGNVQEFLDFFNLGTHRLEGGCHCDFTLSNTLNRPHLYGRCDFSNGYYQNYLTGTEMQNIEARLVADKNVLLLTSLNAKDSQKKGSFEATGKIDLLPLKHFPFVFDTTFTRFNCATFDLITTEANGKLQIKGNLNDALASGHLDILESDVTIPSHIPKKLPNLQVIYKHASAPPFLFTLPKQSPYPLHLNLSVDAPDGIFISGRGVESEWKGKFEITGTQTDIATKGKIELIKGNFLFSGRNFKLTEGSLNFNGEPNVPPYLNLAASIQIKDVLVTAHLKGPLNNPQITLQSSPPLPMGTIMSYLLFGQDLAEINSFQALQLASSIASFAGEGPGILEQTKKSLGIDRIQIVTVSSPTSETGETIAVQVGKYVTEGVLVSYSQGAENSGGNISIEVEGKGGTSWILESDQTSEQKQGKFTFRWAHTY
jgi:hypothetical protein